MNFPGNALRLWAMNVTSPSTVTTAGKTYFDATGGDYQADLPANFFSSPRYVQLIMRGYYSTPASAPVALNVGIDIVQNGTAVPVASTGVFTPIVSMANKGWMLDEIASAQKGSKIGAAGAAQPAGFAGFSTAALGAVVSTANFAALVNTAAMTLDTTQPMSIKPWVEYAGTLGLSLAVGNSLTCQIFAFHASD